MEEIYTTDLYSVTQMGNVIVEFYGNGCLNCQMMAPILSNLEQAMPNVRFYRINADAYPNLVQHYQVTSLPTLILFRNGQRISTIVGVKPLPTLLMLIHESLNYA